MKPKRKRRTKKTSPIPKPLPTISLEPRQNTFPFRQIYCIQVNFESDEVWIGCAPSDPGGPLAFYKADWKLAEPEKLATMMRKP